MLKKESRNLFLRRDFRAVKKILAPIDFSEAADTVMEKAAQTARAFDADLWLVHVAPPEPDLVGHEPDPPVMRKQLADRYREEHRRLQEWAGQLRQEGLRATALLLQGPTAETIRREAKKLGVDLIVIGSHGHGAIYRALVGSVSEGVLRESSCPVLIVPVRKGRS